jgi:hypothetical protein
MFATLAKVTGAKVPNDRPVDSLDQADFFLGKSAKSAREGFPIWGADILLAVKWRNWKLHFYRQDTMFDPPREAWDSIHHQPLHRPARGEADRGYLGGDTDAENRGRVSGVH